MSKLRQDSLILRHKFLAYLPEVSYSKRMASDNKQKLDSLLGILDKLVNIITTIKKDKKITLEALGNVKQDELSSKLGPRIEERFLIKLSIFPKVSLNNFTIYEEDKDGNVINADLIFEVQGFANSSEFSVDYPIFIVDGYIRDPEIVYWGGNRYSIKDFLEEITSDKYSTPEPESQMHYTNERGRSYWSPEPTGPEESEMPFNHTWNPTKWK